MEEHSPSSPHEKKAKRAEETEPVVSSSSMPPSTPAPPLEYDCFVTEEEEAESWNAEDLYELFKEASKEMRELIDEVLKIKLGEIDKDESQPNMMEAAVISMNMRKLSRLDKHCLKKSRDILSEKKQKVEHRDLQIQNLQYEASYLQKEVTSCLELRSQDEDIELVPLDEFLAENPGVINKPNMTEEEQHELMIARLRWEIDIRKSLAMKLEKAELKKEQSKNKIKSLSECLQGTLPALNKMLQATQPVQKLLGIPLQVTHFQNRNAQLLPKPLYRLYIQISTYRECIDKTICVTIDGSVDNTRVSQLERDESAEETGDSDQDDIARAAYHKRPTSTKPAKSSDALFTTHPLSVILTVAYNEHRISLKFDYLTFLDLVTVRAVNLHVDLPGSDNTALEKILSLESFFDNLFPDDRGQLCVIHSEHTLECYKRTEIKPYIWCQKLATCELSLKCNVNENKLYYREEELLAMQILRAIKSCLRAKVLLSIQISALVGRCRMPTEIASMCVPKVISQLKKLNNVPWSRLLAHPDIEKFVDLKIVVKESWVFEAVIERGSANLTALIVVTVEYPAKSPLFLLFMHWKGDNTSASNFAVKELEQEINVYFVQTFPKEHVNNLLRCQMHHLRACFDIYIETERFNEIVEGPREFVKEKVYTSSYRGPGHSRPYKYFPLSRIFTQR